MKNLFEYENPTLEQFLQWDSSLYARGGGEGSGSAICEDGEDDDQEEPIE